MLRDDHDSFLGLALMFLFELGMHRGHDCSGGQVMQILLEEGSQYLASSLIFTGHRWM